MPSLLAQESKGAICQDVWCQQFFCITPVSQITPHQDMALTERFISDEGDWGENSGWRVAISARQTSVKVCVSKKTETVMTASLLLLMFVSFGSLRSRAVEFHTFQDFFSTHASWQLVAEQGLALTGRGNKMCEFLRKRFSQRGIAVGTYSCLSRCNVFRLISIFLLQSYD